MSTLGSIADDTYPLSQTHLLAIPIIVYRGLSAALMIKPMLETVTGRNQSPSSVLNGAVANGIEDASSSVADRSCGCETDLWRVSLDAPENREE